MNVGDGNVIQFTVEIKGGGGRVLDWGGGGSYGRGEREEGGGYCFEKKERYECS